MKAYKIFGIIALALIGLLSCEKPEQDNPTPPNPVTPKIEIPAESQSVFSQGISMDAGTSAQNQTVKFSTTAAWSTDVTDTKASTWLSVQPTSGNAGAVTMTVSAQANTGTKDREATVTIKCGTVTMKFTVKQAGISNVEVTEVTLDKAELGLVEGQEAELIATVKPDNATDKTVTWSTSDSAVATVTDGKVKAVKAGTATITAKAGEKTSTCKVTVTTAVIPVESVTLDKPSATLKVGETVTLTATVKPDDATDKTVTWITSDASVATVDNGVVTAKKVGTATITAKAGEKSATCAITVEPTPVTGITLDNATVTLKEGQEIQLTATVAPVDATDKTVTWSSNKTDIATVSNSGKVKAIKEGVATITAKAGNKEATCVVTVSKNVIAVTSVSLDKPSASLKVGETVTLIATVKPDDATDKTVTWTTSDASVATVSNGVVTAKKIGTATITAKAGEKSATCAITVNPTAVTGITLDNATVTLKEGQEIQLTATVAPVDATDKTVTWSSNKTDIASVSNTGKVKAIKEGVATITAKAGSKEATCVVTVSKNVIAVTSVTLDKPSATLKVGETVTLTATVKPDDATDKTATWTTSDATVATVNNGVVIAKKVGTATITAKAGEKSATCAITVEPTPVTSVTLDKTSALLKAGETVTLTATVKPDDATDKTVTWTTSNASVATVDNGVVTGKKIGTATITAKAGEKSATCAITVNPTPVTSVTLDKPSATLKVGETVTLTATVKPDDATDKTVTWTTSDASVATVNNGVVTAKKVGSATITAKVGDVSATCIISVTATGNHEGMGEEDWIIPVIRITLNKTSISLKAGETITLTATVKPDDATDKTVTWTSSDASVATVENGVVTAKKVGTATITAKAGDKSATCAVTVKDNTIEDVGFEDWD